MKKNIPATRSKSLKNNFHSNQKNLLLSLVGLILIILVVGVVAYYLGKRTGNNSVQSNKSISHLESTVNPIISIKQANQKENTFQAILTKYCKKIDAADGSYFIVIQPDVLPVLIDRSIIKINTQKQEAVTCSTEKPPYGYVFVVFERNNMNKAFRLYDKTSQELGRGGVPSLGSYGTVIKDDGKIRFTIYLRSDFENISLIGSTSVVMRGEKSLPLSNGEMIYANYDEIAIDPKDSRLVSLLNKYSKPSDFKPGARELTSFPIEEIKNTFFNDLSHLQPSEKNALTEIQTVLSAITPK